ncbi:chloramphenicol-sensitive protein RarD [Novosphingobium chloroacetimidivorans]|uniref:Chloramphenicol-sensitive protein RarD n=1 Tax=Novosphingobium chloroacetimidivorans TaxID=1428314 RepID=A0A7W7K8J0_9SPHN|nr:EamA family transporter RarD [Novosphingobium chloroacetimidivorans]MBB4857518.1 chloramphenicol-sensitive protein RarD [Novosphingobium chloroacetimidivorans]
MNTGAKRSSGLPYALGAYLIWGMIPLYFRLLHAVPPGELVGWRVVFTLPVCFVLVAVLRQFGEVRRALTAPRTLALLTGSALLIGVNWLIYVVAIATDHVLAASLGYYINPLMNVLAGTLFLHERLSRRQWLAVALAAVGVAILAWGALSTLWISMGLAFSFCGYGLVRKLAPVESLPGLTVETMVLMVPALAMIGWQSAQPGGISLGDDAMQDTTLALAGIVTGIPLLMFATAARRMSYSTLGFVQFLAPTLVFLLGLFVFHEPLRTVQLASFVMIWAAIAVFCWDLLSARRVVTEPA